MLSTEALSKWISIVFFGSKIFSAGAVLFGKVKEGVGDILNWLGEFSLFMSSSADGARSRVFFAAKEFALLEVDDSGVGQAASTSIAERMAVLTTFPLLIGLTALVVPYSRSLEATAMLVRYLSVTLLSLRTGATRSGITSVEAASMIDVSTVEMEASSTDGCVLRVSASRDSCIPEDSGSRSSRLPTAASTSNTFFLILLQTVKEEDEDDEEEKAEEQLFCFLGMHFPESDLDRAMVLPKDFRPLELALELEVLRRRDGGLTPSTADDVDEDASTADCSLLVPVLPHDEDDSIDNGPDCSFFANCLNPLPLTWFDSTEMLFFTF